MGQILVTGANGLVGRHLVARLVREGHRLVLAYRTRPNFPQPENSVRSFQVEEVGPKTDWRSGLDGCDAVIHLAAQVPARGASTDLFRKVNDWGTARLLEQVSKAKIGRIILLSSIFSVADHAEDRPVDDVTSPRPVSAYGRSKLAAEMHVASFARTGGIGVSLRPPLVYCGEAGGNWRLLMRLAASPFPLPFAAVDNRRSLIALENLVDAIVSVVDAGEGAVSGAFAVADDYPVSLADLVLWLREAVGQRPHLFGLPPTLMRLALNASGRAGQAQSLFGNLEVDASRFRRIYSWSPAVTTRDAVMRSGLQYAALRAGQNRHPADANNPAANKRRK